MIKRSLVQAGIDGIDSETVETYNMEIVDGTVVINDSMFLHRKNILKVLESPVEYEIQTVGVFIILSRIKNKVSTLVRC